jgi:hypothetical protein
MPADFNKCVADGGRVRTIKIGKGRYAHICYDKAGKGHMGEIKLPGGKPAADQPGT